MREPTDLRSFSLSITGARVRSSGLVNGICPVYGVEIYVNLQFTEIIDRFAQIIKQILPIQFEFPVRVRLR
jgi:hypothetical protein